MGLIPETEKQHNDMLDLVVDGSHEIELVKQPDGTYSKQLVLNTKRIWYKTHLVDSPTFGRMAFELEELDRIAERAYNHMVRERADVVKKSINGLYASYRASIDAKSSESLRDKNNTKSTLLDKIGRNKIEKAYTIKGDAGKSILAGLIGRDQEKEEQQY